MASAIFHHAMTAVQAGAGNSMTPLDGSTSGTNSTSGSSDSSDSSGSATISANDFLTLLVTEMQNQDPTADQDPNEYINQLVQVNSLEQLIDINQTLTGDASGSTSSSSSSTTALKSGGARTESAESTTGAPVPGSETAQIMQALHVGGGSSPGLPGFPGTAGIASASSDAARVQSAPIAGNLGLQKTNPAATRVGHALAGRSHAAARTAAPKAN